MYKQRDYMTVKGETNGILELPKNRASKVFEYRRPFIQMLGYDVFNPMEVAPILRIRF